jgi:hypothetical protein
MTVNVMIPLVRVHMSMMVFLVSFLLMNLFGANDVGAIKSISQIDTNLMKA